MKFKLHVDEHDSYRAFGQIVRYQRITNHYTLRDLATLANVSHTLISNIEKGKVVSHPDTLRDLLSALDIKFSTDKSIINDFTIFYDEAFNFLFEYEYKKAKIKMDQMMANESVYINSIVASDYLSIKYLYLALTDEIYGEHVDTIESFNMVYEYLGDYQKKMFNLAYGIYKFNHGLFGEAYQCLKKVRKIAPSDFDMLAEVYMIKTYVKMYRFMDAVTLSDDLIVRLENNLLYIRAMEVRLSIAHAYIIVLKLDSAEKLIDKVYRFAKSYNANLILSECDLLYGTIHFKKGEYELAERKMGTVISNDVFITYFNMKIAYLKRDLDKAIKCYNDFKLFNVKKNSKISEYMFKIVLNDLEIEKIDDKELVKTFNHLIAFGKRAIDLEFLDGLYTLYIKYYKEKKMYKRALELSEEIRGIRRYGVNFIKGYK